VHVIHAADGMIPSDMATGSEEGITEERRLFYVALTRARRRLYIYWPLRYYHRRMGLDDPHNFAQLTRFLPDDVRLLFDHEAHGPIAEESAPAPAPDARVAIDASLGDLLS
jgi:DNA helicase II / ATP-dependent DNA helicase PcrA